MSGEKVKFQLSDWQYQAIADMGIDAWYLSPLARADKDDEAHDELIESLVSDLSEIPESKISSVTVVEDITKPTMPDASIPKAYTAISVAPSINTRRGLAMPDPIKLVTSGDFSSPQEQSLEFPVQVLPDEHSWESLEISSQALADEAKQPCFMGQGEKQSEDVFVFPPPERARKFTGAEVATSQLGLSDKEQQLLNEMLSSVGLVWGKSYRTRLLKHATAFGQDPDESSLGAHFPLLASELALVLPKRVWLIGSLACHAILQTKAPLSTLVNQYYTLSFSGVDNQRHAAQVFCLPPIDYLLALPAEKGKVWQQIKALSLVN